MLLNGMHPPADNDNAKQWHTPNMPLSSQQNAYQQQHQRHTHSSPYTDQGTDDPLHAKKPNGILHDPLPIARSRSVSASTGTITPISTVPNSPLIESPRPPQPKPPRSLVVFSGGTACNSLVNVFQTITADTTYILAVSDDGGSTSEVLRVLGGPALGDIRSRLTRLIDVEEGDGEKAAIKRLLSHRLPVSGDSRKIKEEWMDIVEGKHRLWAGIPSERKECIRAFLVVFQTEVIRSRKSFDFRNGSIGNFFLCGADQFFKSVESAIFLFCSITGISNTTQIVPCINTQRSMTIAAQMDSGRIIRGQCAISHPSEYDERGVSFAADRRTSLGFGLNGNSMGIDIANGHVPGGWTAPPDITPGASATTAPGEMYPSPVADHEVDARSSGNLTYDKDVGRLQTHTGGRIENINRLFYINEYGQEIFPDPNPKVLGALSSKRALVYSIGSLYTSLVPSLILRQVGRAIATSPSIEQKILLLNSCHDRELPAPSTAVDVIRCIVDALDSSLRPHFPRSYPREKYVTHVVYVQGGEIEVPEKELRDMGIRAVPVRGRQGNEMTVYDEEDLYRVLMDIMRV